MTDNKENEKFEEARKSLLRSAPDRDFIIVSETISRSLHAAITKLLAEKQTKENCALFLTTLGGDPDGAYRIARCLKHHYKHVRLIVMSHCKSAGTLLAIGADEIAIGDLGELGPLDMQVMKPEEMLERGSGLDVLQALQVNLEHTMEAFRQCLFDLRGRAMLSTKLAGEFASRIVAGIAEPLYAQIDPFRLGELQRLNQIAKEYGDRLNQKSKNLKGNALTKLIAEYPAHTFVIDRKEAKELFHRVMVPTPEEVAFATAVWHIINTERNIGPILLPPLEEVGEAHGQQQHGQPAAQPSQQPGATDQERGHSAADGKSVGNGAANDEAPAA